MSNPSTGERDRESRSEGEETSDVSPSADLPSLDDRQVALLRDIGGCWREALGDGSAWGRALPVDPHLTYEDGEGPGRAGRFVEIQSTGSEGAGDLRASAEAMASDGRASRVAYRLRRAVLGAPLTSSAVADERMRKLVALPVLSSDALSSVAYGPEAMLSVLVLAGGAQLGLSLPIAAAIAVLMVAVGLGYRQVIRAYPHGGGSYVVAKDNFGHLGGMLAASGLIIDYILTVAVSVASGVAAITSAVPSVAPDTVVIGLVVIAVLVAGNLRGVRQAGAVFAGPTYAFILAILVVVVVGLVRAASNGFSPAPPPPIAPIEGLGVLLVLRAFSSGSTAMTGIEAISNAVPAFRPPEWRNARATLTVMVCILIGLFAATVFLTHLYGVAPSPSETVLSQLAHASVGNGVLYWYVQITTALILLLAANAAFNGFPRMLFFLARDRYAPRAFLRLGDRLSFSNGILLLAVVAALLFVVFGGSTDALIPLYAVGVFLAFTAAQSGMVVHWWRSRASSWRRSAVINAVGAVLAAVVLVITSVTKFTEGAWLVVILVPLLVLLLSRIKRHYVLTARALALHPVDAGEGDGSLPMPAPSTKPAVESGEADPERQESPLNIRHLTIVPVATLDLAGLHALAYATSLAQPTLAVHISPDEEEAQRFHRYWEAWGDHLPLEVVVSPYRAIVAPLAHYIEALHRQRPELTITVVLPELTVKRRWHALLHNQIGSRLRSALRPQTGIVVTTVPFHLPA